MYYELPRYLYTLDWAFYVLPLRPFRMNKFEYVLVLIIKY